jgi:hypothetical protein
MTEADNPYRGLTARGSIADRGATKPPGWSGQILAISRTDVVAEPFPHVVKENILPPPLFEALRADFPGTRIFQEQVAENGTAGSRTGSGFDIYRGDPAYLGLVERSAAWASFDAYVNSDQFAGTFREVFADHLAAMGLRVDLDRAKVDTEYVEPRATLAETATFTDRLYGLGRKLFNNGQTSNPTSLFTRLDIHKSLGGYAKPPHCDRPNRLCSLIVYFTDAEAAGLEGGDLLLFKHKQAKAIRSYERHPRPGNVVQVASLKPKANLGVFFPCQNNSYHGVTPITTPGIERDFLYINISGRARSLW